MKNNLKRIISSVLSIFLMISSLPAIIVYADSVVEIFDDSGVHVTEKIYITEYRSKQLHALTPSTSDDGIVSGTEIEFSDGRYVIWKSSLPLLANVDEA